MKCRGKTEYCNYAKSSVLTAEHPQVMPDFYQETFKKQDYHAGRPGAVGIKKLKNKGL